MVIFSYNSSINKIAPVLVQCKIFIINMQV